METLKAALQTRPVQGIAEANANAVSRFVTYSLHASQVTRLGGLPPEGVGQTPPEINGILRDTVNKRVVRILLECTLVTKKRKQVTGK